MKTFLDICLCVVALCLLIGVLDQIVKLANEKLTITSAATQFTGQTSINLTYRHRLTILIWETVLFVLLRWVILLW